MKDEYQGRRRKGYQGRKEGHQGRNKRRKEGRKEGTCGGFLTVVPGVGIGTHEGACVLAVLSSNLLDTHMPLRKKGMEGCKKGKGGMEGNGREAKQRKE